MFDISYIHPELIDDGGYRVGQLVMQSKIEEFSSSFERWSVRDYEQQWTQGIRRLVEGADRSALITHLPHPSEEFIELAVWWPMWRLGDQILIQEQWIDQAKIEAGFDLGDLYRSIEAYDIQAKDGKKASQWRVTLQDLRDFLDRCKTPS